MLLFKLFSFNNIIFYITYFILILFLLFLGYKYIYLEQSIYLITNKLNKIEIELNNPSLKSSLNKNNDNMRVADIIMNEIFNDNYCDVNGSCSISHNANANTNTNTNTNTNANTNANTNTNTNANANTTEIIEETPIEIFDLKKETEDKESVISSHTDTKKSLMKLNLEKLKAKCEDKHLATDGTKQQLVERLLNYENSKILTEEIVDIE